MGVSDLGSFLRAVLHELLGPEFTPRGTRARVGSPSGWRDEIDDLTFVPAIDAVMRVVTIEVGDERSRIADRRHARRYLRRAFVAGVRDPATLPAKSDVSENTDWPSGPEPASTRSRTSAATLLPVARASLLRRRRVGSGSLIVIPFTNER